MPPHPPSITAPSPCTQSVRAPALRRHSPRGFRTDSGKPATARWPHAAHSLALTTAKGVTPDWFARKLVTPYCTKTGRVEATHDDEPDNPRFRFELAGKSLSYRQSVVKRGARSPSVRPLGYGTTTVSPGFRPKSPPRMRSLYRTRMRCSFAAASRRTTTMSSESAHSVKPPASASACSNVV